MTIKLWAHVSADPGKATTANPVVVVEPLISLDMALVPGKDIFHSDLFFVEATGIPGVAQGWIYDGKAFAAPPPVTPPAPTVPLLISRRQFFQQLAVQGVITQDEALAAVQTGAIPAEMEPLITALPAAAQFATKMKISGATDFNRADTVTVGIGTAYGWTSAQLDAFWIEAFAL